METFKLSMPNGIVIEYTSDTAHKVVNDLRKQDKLPIGVYSEAGQVKVAKPAKPFTKPSKKAPVTKAAKQPKATKQPKVAKPASSPKGNGKELLAQIRQLKTEGRYAEAVALTPKGWLQVIGEIQLHAERHNGNGAQFNAAVPAAKAAKKAKKARKPSKKAATKVVEEAPVGALNMAADTGSVKQAPLPPKVEAAISAKLSDKDLLADIGVDGFAAEVLLGEQSMKSFRDLYCSTDEDEVLFLIDACKQEAILLEEAAERIEAAKLPKHIVDAANGLVELWKTFGRKLNSTVDRMTAAA